MRHMALWFLLLLSADPDGEAQRFELLDVGSFHEDEVSLSSAGEWLALIFDNGRYSLELTSVDVRLAHDVISDKKGETTGRDVTVNPALTPIVLIRGPHLRPGVLSTAAPEPVEIRLGQTSWIGPYSIGVRCPADESVEYRCRLFLVGSDRKTQEICEFSAYNAENGQVIFKSEFNPVIIWAGDLDRDGGVDLLVDTSNHSNESRITLFLSSAAKPGELVGKVAEFASIGC